MPKPHCSAEYLEDALNTQPLCVGCGGFVPDGESGRSQGKARRPMWAPIPVTKLPERSVGAQPSKPPVAVDRFGRQFGGNWPAVEAAARINRTDGRLPDAAEVAGFGFFGDE